MLIQRTNPPNLQVNHANNIVACDLFRFSHKQMSLVSFCNLLYFFMTNVTILIYPLNQIMKK